MKVWVLEKGYDYEGSEVLGVYASDALEKGKAAAEKDAYSSLEYKVSWQERGPDAWRGRRSDGGVGYSLTRMLVEGAEEGE